MSSERKRVGITTTVPSEVVYAAGWQPVDLNNVFINSRDPMAMVEAAEADGFPRNVCSWIKGIFTAAKELGVSAVIGCVQGDCSNTQALLENLEMDGVEVIPFAFPHEREAPAIEASIRRLCDSFGTTFDEAEQAKRRLDVVRAAALEIDALTWQTAKVTGKENHLWLVSCSDFNGDPDLFARDAAAFLKDATGRPARGPAVRLGFVGVPPICADLYEFLEDSGVRVVLNEVQRQFAMPAPTASLVEQYRLYTYPYDVFFRLEDIQAEIERRRIDGVIHYVQSFCHRHIQDRILRRRLRVPIMTLEYDRPAPLDGAAKIRIEAFLEMLRSQLHA